MASLIGKEIGKYRITERLGQGGMAEVYAGIHTHLDRKVAVKVLHSYLLEGGDFVARFKREAKAVANLRHPNIVQVYDFDIQDDLIFMVMEYVDGVNLHTKLVEVGNKGERMPIKLIGSIINDIASALDYAHTKDMLHRDIKPSNIMIDRENKAYLTDFGIAKLLSDQKFTATGTLVGTPAYMSPEQSLGDDVSKESDIYSLGVVAFEMLTGQVPYDAKTPIGIVHKQINDPIPNMSELVDGVPGTAQEVIDRALAKAPESRFSSAEDLVGALRTALVALESSDPIAIPAEESPTVVDDALEAPTVTMKAEEMEQATVVMEAEKKKEEPPAKEPKKKPPKEKPTPKPIGEKKKVPLWAYIAGGVALLAVVGVILTQVLQIDLLGTTRNIITNSVEVSIHASNGSDGLSIEPGGDGDFAEVTIGDLDAWQTGNGQALHNGDWNTYPDFYIYFRIDDEIMNRLPTGSEVYIEVELLDAGTDSFNIEYDSHYPGPSPSENFRSTDFHTKTNTGDFIIVQFSLQDPFFGNRTGEGDFRLNDNSDGEEVIRSVKVVYLPEEGQGQNQDQDQDQPSGNGENLYNQAVAFFEDGSFDETIEFCYQALDAGYETASVYQLIGRTYRRIGEFDLAVEPLDIALELDPEHFWARYNRGLVRMNLGDFGGAIEDLNIATELEPDMWHPWHYLGESYYWTFDDAFIQHALEALSRAIEIDPGRYESFYYRGRVKWSGSSRDMEGALSDLTHAIEMNPDDPGPWNMRGVIYWETEQWELCIPDYSEFIARDPENPNGYLERGDCYVGLGDNDSARRDYQSFLERADGEEFREQIDRVEEWWNSPDQ